MINRFLVSIMMFVLFQGVLMSEMSINYHYEFFSPLVPATTLSDVTMKDLNAHYVFPLLNTEDDVEITIDPVPDDLLNTNAEVVGKALFYPNPFRLQDGAQLGFRLTKDAEIEIQIYDIRFKKIYEKTHAYIQGVAYNKLTFNRQSFESDLSAGVYYFVIMQNNRLLYKGKFAIIP